MTGSGLFQIGLYFVVLAVLIKPLGGYMAKVYEGTPNLLTPILSPVEKLLYRIFGVHSEEEMPWKTYTASVLVFNILGAIVVYLLQRFQNHLPLNPQGFPAVSWDSSFNTAVSFITNTNWQGYGGESTMSYLTQMMGLGVQNFLSAATAMAVLIALIRGFVRRNAQTIGNFWVDFTRSILYILLPLSIVFTIILVSQGVVQNFKAYRTASLMQTVSYDKPVVDSKGNTVKDASGKDKTEPAQMKEQQIPFGPAASQIAIKQLGTNGGGFFNVNSAHPFENPTPLSNFLESLAILLIAAALCYTFGKMVEDTRQGWVLLAAMFIILIPLLIFCYYSETIDAPYVKTLSAAVTSDGNMEGKEVRLGVANSALWAAVTTAASNGSVNSMHDSFSPLGGLIPLFLMQLGEIIFGGVGSGLYGMIVFAIISVFVAGLMVGRTPEYLGKKIESFEMKMSSLVILIPAVCVLLGTAVAVIAKDGVAGIANPGPHGFSEILYAFSSCANNNGSAFAGLSANTLFYNIVLGIVMLLGRFGVIVPVLAIAGSLAEKKHVPVGSGTLPTHTPLFVVFLIGIIIIVGALTFLPSLSLGPIAEHLTAIK
ncbi:MAG: potassium-transporting ATPase subunit KdpA [Nitrospirae bacterium]|nr:potassium-transporting ATPase subunit KdpA [Nitrospirota bacterium]MBF0533671.1 potassium-transporting ATPase subunit KdpA [Nitrospirota bacterium]MBF0616678.1 potassium-transporting ATPase subunit KdpA [Nitrospirota bacterium]